MTGFIFLPIPTVDLQIDTLRWQMGQVAKGKVPYEILCHSSVKGTLKGLFRRINPCLRDVQTSDKLYICAHGIRPNKEHEFATSLGASRPSSFWSSGDEKQYSAAALAKLLAEEGLSQRVHDVRLYACRSLEMARKLKLEMVELGYKDVIVTGYPGAVTAQYGEVEFHSQMHKGIIYDDWDVWYRASDLKRSY